jgi:chromosome segregation ATPase
MGCESKTCENDHVELNGECVLRNSPKGRIALRSLEAGVKIKKEQSFPAYADEAVRESINNLTARLNEIGQSVEFLEKTAGDVKDLQKETKSIVDRVNQVGASVQEIGGTLKEVGELRKSTDKVIERVNKVGTSMEIMEEAVKSGHNEDFTKIYEELQGAKNRISELSEKLHESEKVASKNESRFEKISKENKELNDLAEKSAKDLETVRAMAEEIAQNFLAFQRDLKKTDVVASSADGLKMIEKAADQAVEYVKSLVVDSEKVVAKNLGEVQDAVAHLSGEAAKSAEVISQAKNDLEETAANVSDVLKVNTTNYAHALQDLTAKSAAVLTDLETHEEQKLVHAAQATRATLSNDLLRQGAALQTRLAVEADVALSRTSRPESVLPSPQEDLLPTQREEIRTSTNLVETSRRLGMRELQAASDMNAALDLENKLNSAVNDYNQAIAQARAINDQISEMQRKNTKTPTEEGLNMLAQAQAASERQMAVIDSARSQVSSLQGQYNKLSTLAASEKEIVEKERAAFDASVVESSVSRQKDTQRQAEELRNNDNSEAKKQERLKSAMQHLMRRGVKYGTVQFSSIMTGIKSTVARGEKVNYEELDVVIETSR